MFNLPPFRLYGLLGCPHCVQAEAFLRNRLVPAMAIIANDDPIALAGVKQLTGGENFPVLCCTFNKEIITGYKEEDYDRLVKLFHSLAGAGAFGIPNGEQQPQPQVAGQVQGTGLVAGATELPSVHGVLDGPVAGEVKSS